MCPEKVAGVNRHFCLELVVCNTAQAGTGHLPVCRVDRCSFKGVESPSQPVEDVGLFPLGGVCGDVQPLLLLSELAAHHPPVEEVVRKGMD